jgi:hypothetical protein
MYEQKARELISTCHSLRLPCDIQERPDTGKWRNNTAIKPRYIREMLDKHDHVLWLDCDGTLFQRPQQVIHQREDVDILACPHRTNLARDWHVGIMAFRSNERTKAFVDEWIRQVEENIENEVTDERAFMKLMEDHPEVKFQSLPDNYHVVMVRGADLKDAVFGLGISRDADKQKTYQTKDRLEWI